MNALFGCRPARHALLLISILQVPCSLAYPSLYDSTSSLESLNEPEHLPSTQTTAIPLDVVYQIPDGQVQAPQPTEENVATSPMASSVAISIRDPVSSTSTNIQASYTPDISTSNPDDSLARLSTSAVQTATGSFPSNTGSVIASLYPSAQGSSLPFLTSEAYSTGSLSLADTATLSDIQPTATSAVTSLSADNIFQVIATDSPPPQIVQRADHPVPREGIQPQPQKLQTNKFYSNLYLGNQSDAVFTFPYSVAWLRGGAVDGDQSISSWGMAISHVERADVDYAGPKFDPNTGLRVDAGDWAFYANPLGTNSVILSAAELANSTDGSPGLTTESLEWGSVTANLFAVGRLTPTIQFPLVQGSSFITANYSSATPLIQSGAGFESITYAGEVVHGSTYKYSAQVKGGFTWLIYVTPHPVRCAHYAVNSFTLNGTTHVQGHSEFTGLIQVAKVPMHSTSDVESLYDGAAGAYAASVDISGTVQDKVGSYTFSWKKQGNQDQSLLMFALPHHVSSFSYDTTARIADLRLMTPTKGLATAVRGDSWKMIESDLPIDMDFAPWSPTAGAVKVLPEAAKQAILTAGVAEVAQNITAQTETGSFYYDGKALAKFAGIVYVLHQLVQNETLALTGLLALETEFARHVQGQQTYPLVYDSAWGGAVSVATYENGDPQADFGNTYYNDHHFHYGYFVYTAAVIAYLDPTWLSNGTNKAWVNTLVRDFANSIADDPWFPFSRSFDWYHGHSWAAGLFAAPDGKNQESSSEDTMASYAIKMWGQVIGDTNMMARGNLMLAVQARTLQDYYLYDSDNAIQPAEFIGNKAAGILFENKINHTTYFGDVVEYIQGIHMIPIMPFSSLIRTPAFVQQEWDVYFANYSDGVQPYIDRVEGGWRGILLANYAIVNPRVSYDFFAAGDFNQTYLDPGASQTWYLAWSAALKQAAGY